MNSKSARRSRALRHNNKPRTAVRLRFFEFTEPKARAVHVAGSFNGWQPESSSMACLGDGCWVKELQLSPGRYEYRIVVDGEWIPDLFAEDHVPNPFGGINSVLTVSPQRPLKLRWTADKRQTHQL